MSLKRNYLFSAREKERNIRKRDEMFTQEPNGCTNQ